MIVNIAIYGYIGIYVPALLQICFESEAGAQSVVTSTSTMYCYAMHLRPTIARNSDFKHWHASKMCDKSSTNCHVLPKVRSCVAMRLLEITGDNWR